MTNPVTLSVLYQGKKLNSHVCDQPTELTCGRSEDNAIQLPKTQENLNASRHHCIFRIDPPQIWVTDLDSKNGTFVNHEKMDTSDHHPIELYDGDEVQIGQTIIQVRVDREPDDFVVPAAHATVEAFA